MKKCKSCMKEIDEKAKRCPFCREDQRGFFRRHPILTFLGILFISPFVIAQMLVSSVENRVGKIQSNNPVSPAPERQDTFVAGVNFTGSEFVISNLDKHICQNARMQVNGSYTLEGYNLESALDSTLKTGEATVYRVGAGQFTKGDGSRFNPFTTKPLNFSISCRGNNELRSAFWYGEF